MIPFFDLSDIGDRTDMARLDLIPTTLRNVPTMTMAAMSQHRKRKSLPPGYQPTEVDVCCGRGKRHWNHSGNVFFRQFIHANVQRYIDAPSKITKTTVVVSIVDHIRNLGGKFLKEDLKGHWYDIGDPLAREKVGHSLRDQVCALNRQDLKQEAKQQCKKETIRSWAPTLPPMPAPVSSDISNGLDTSSGYWAPSQPTQPQELGQAQERSEQSKLAMEESLLVPSMTPSQQQHPGEQQSLHSYNTGPNNMVKFESPIAETPIEPADDNVVLSFSSSVATISVTDACLVDQTDNSIDNRGGVCCGDGGSGEVVDEDDDAQSDGSHERTGRRSGLASSFIIDRFERRPSFVFDISTSISSSDRSSKRSSGWSVLKSLDLRQLDQMFMDSVSSIKGTFND